MQQCHCLVETRIKLSPCFVTHSHTARGRKMYRPDFLFSQFVVMPFLRLPRPRTHQQRAQNHNPSAHDSTSQMLSFLGETPSLAPVSIFVNGFARKLRLSLFFGYNFSSAFWACFPAAISFLGMTGVNACLFRRFVSSRAYSSR